MSSHNSSDAFNFTDEEIKSELSRLGYNDIGSEQFEEFKRGKCASVFDGAETNIFSL